MLLLAKLCLGTILQYLGCHIGYFVLFLENYSIFFHNILRTWFCFYSDNPNTIKLMACFLFIYVIFCFLSGTHFRYFSTCIEKCLIFNSRGSPQLNSPNSLVLFWWSQNKNRYWISLFFRYFRVILVHCGLCSSNSQ